jgi:cold shock CspA family protein
MSVLPTVATTATTTEDITRDNYPRVIGCVKFFDKSAGFGFVSVLKNAELTNFSEKDIFAHFSGIHSENEKQYKYLVKGEYVEFRIVPSTKQNPDGTPVVDKYNAVDITGIQGGKLMCETNFSEFVSKRQQQQPINPFTTSPNYYGQVEQENEMDIDIPQMQTSPFNGSSTRQNLRRNTHSNASTGGRGRGPTSIQQQRSTSVTSNVRQILRKNNV